RKWWRGCLSDGDVGGGGGISLRSIVCALRCAGEQQKRDTAKRRPAPRIVATAPPARRAAPSGGAERQRSPAPGGVLTPATSERWYNSSIRACGRPQVGGSCPWRR